jgi:hypothetical protein
MRVGALDLLAPRAGRITLPLRFIEGGFAPHISSGGPFRIGILGFLTYKRAMSELSFQEVYITDPLHPYIRYIYTLCVYIAGYFFRFFGFFMDFMDFLGFLPFLLDFLLSF